MIDLFLYHLSVFRNMIDHYIKIFCVKREQCLLLKFYNQIWLLQDQGREAFEELAAYTSQVS